MLALFDRESLLAAEAVERPLQHAFAQAFAQLASAVDGARIDHHDFAAERQGCQAIADPAGLVDGVDGGRPRFPGNGRSGRWGDGALELAAARWANVSVARNAVSPTRGHDRG